MDGSYERVNRIMHGQQPDRAALFDLIHNDAVFEHFRDGVPIEVGDIASAIHSIVEATDATRTARFAPNQPNITFNTKDQEIRQERWTTWIGPRTFASSEQYKQVKQQEMAQLQTAMERGVHPQADPLYKRICEHQSWCGDDYYYMPAIPTPGFMEVYDEIGLETFSYYLFECEDVLIDQLELKTNYACLWAEALPHDAPFETVFLGEDIAFATGTLINPQWLRQHFFPCLKRVINAYHAQGKKVLFHSDGNLNDVMDDLVAVGIDALNPIEVAAGMDLTDLHRRYPQLVFVGGIDVSQLLPFGSPQQIVDAVVSAIDDTEGKILVGSSTEIHNEVPLENYLAMRQATMDYRY